MNTDQLIVVIGYLAIPLFPLFLSLMVLWRGHRYSDGEVLWGGLLYFMFANHAISLFPRFDRLALGYVAFLCPLVIAWAVVQRKIYSRYKPAANK